MSEFRNTIDAMAADATFLTNLRRDIHAHPELCFEERRTSDLIAATLTSWQIPVHRGIAKTGVVGVIKSGSSERAMGLRADMDALPMTERNRFAHASVHHGRMHACGHDGHIAMLLAAAKHLSTHRNFDGTVYLIFQPAEEAGGGAREMIREGLFQRFPMQAVFGVHNWPDLPAGQFAVKGGPVFASSNEFQITIGGKGTHAAMPNAGIDPIPAACQLVQALQTIITRNKRPIDAAVISVTGIHAGEVTNVIPDACLVRGTIRTFSPQVLDMIEQRMRQVAEATCLAFGASCEFELRRKYPATINHPTQAQFVRALLGSLVGTDNVKELEPTMAAEDFSFYLIEKPGCYFLVGNGAGAQQRSAHRDEGSMLHSPVYDFNDELIVPGGAMWVHLVERWFAAADGVEDCGALAHTAHCAR